MKVLFTADWQMSWSNSAKVDLMVGRLLQLHKQHDLAAVFHCGDVKDALNPVDQRVANQAIQACGLFRNFGLPMFVVLGNHDQLSTQVDAANWFPTLQAAGATVYDKPGVYQLQQGTEVLRYAVLPYNRDSAKLAANAEDLAKQRASLLLFHAEIHGCRYSNNSVSRGGALSLEKLFAKKYSLCVGGHIHLRQWLTPGVAYVGSPFPTDWTEVNCDHSFLLWDTKENRCWWERTGVPGYYDPGLPNFQESKPKTWVGASVRIRVPVEEGQSSVPAMQKAATDAAEKYPGAKVHIEPLWIEGEVSPVADAKDQNDSGVLAKYLEAQLVESMQPRRREMAAFLAWHLQQASKALPGDLAFQLESLEACNVLSFPRVTLQLNQPGLTVVSGVNHDWEGRSNGAGKSSYLQLLAIALFGQTLKGQKADAWRRRNSGDEECWVRLKFTLFDGRLVEVLRGRKPRGLRLWVAGEEVTSGERESLTQAHLEQLTGLSWETLATVLYIDQTRVNRLLTGTDGDRKTLFRQFLRLDRFVKAQEGIKAERARTVRKLEMLDVEIGVLQDAVANQKSLNKSGKPVGTMSSWKKRLDQLKKTLDAAQVSLSEKEEAQSQLLANREKLHNRNMEAMAEVSKATVCLQAVETAITRLQGLGAQCTLCGQGISASYRKEQLATARKEQEAKQLVVNSTRKKLKETEEALKKATAGLEEQATWIRLATNTVADKLEKLAEARAAFQAYQGRLLQWKKARRLLRRTKRTLRLAAQYARYLRVSDLPFLQEAIRIFGKDGILAYMASRLCPRLNRAAQYYATLFSEGEITVTFELVGEDIQLTVENNHGGESLDSQSAGEMRMVSLIVSFALRQILGRTSLLIADEPGEGLDETNAKQFATALVEVADRFGSLFVISHNPHILAQLSDARQIVIEKRNRMSIVCTPGV